VLLVRYEAAGNQPHEQVRRHAQWSEYATFRYKIFNARRHRAAAVILVTGPKIHAAQGEELVPLQG